MRILFVLACLAAAGCGYSEPHMRAKYAAMSDAELIRENQRANRGFHPEMFEHEKWTLDEMKRRGLVGQGRDGLPKQ